MGFGVSAMATHREGKFRLIYAIGYGMAKLSKTPDPRLDMEQLAALPQIQVNGRIQSYKAVDTRAPDPS